MAGQPTSRSTLRPSTSVAAWASDSTRDCSTASVIAASAPCAQELRCPIRPARRCTAGWDSRKSAPTAASATSSAAGSMFDGTNWPCARTLKRRRGRASLLLPAELRDEQPRSSSGLNTTTSGPAERKGGRTQIAPEPSVAAQPANQQGQADKRWQRPVSDRRKPVPDRQMGTVVHVEGGQQHHIGHAHAQDVEAPPPVPPKLSCRVAHRSDAERDRTEDEEVTILDPPQRCHPARR